MQWNCLYSVEGQILKIGPFASEADLIEGVKVAIAEEEFVFDETRVYMLTPACRLLELTYSDLADQSEPQEEVHG